MPVTIKNTNEDGRFAMALKVGDKFILPGEEASFDELAPIVEVATSSKMKIQAELKAQEMKEKAEARKKAKEGKTTGAEYVWDPYKRKPCCVCPPCAICGPCIDDLINPDFPGAGLFCFPCQMVCGKLTDPVCIGHCKCFELCDFCLNCRCSCCPPSCTCCNITCPPECCTNCCKIPDCSCCMPKCLKCCPPSCEWCGIQCPPQCCLDCMPKCLKCCPPSCEWCGIQCPPQCCLDCLSCKVIGCACIFCHFTCTTYPKCCPACLFCADETIKVSENKLIVKGKVDPSDVQLEVPPQAGAAPFSAEMAR